MSEVCVHWLVKQKWKSLPILWDTTFAELRK